MTYCQVRGMDYTLERGRYRPRQCPRVCIQRTSRAFFAFHLAAPEDGRTPARSFIRRLLSMRPGTKRFSFSELTLNQNPTTIL